MPNNDVPSHIADFAKSLAVGSSPIIERSKGGQNNGVFKVTNRQGQFAVKWYPPQGKDSRDRLGTEYKALKFFERWGPCPVPRAVEAYPSKHIAVYEWCEGAQVNDISDADISQALNFLSLLLAASRKQDAMAFSAASEACLSGAEIVRQIRTRYARLNDIAEERSALRRLLEKAFKPALAKHVDQAKLAYNNWHWSWNDDLPSSRRILSPSDMGFHNAVRRRSGELVFLDFEYFGWDDPVKLVADFMLHPGMSLGARHRQKFHDGAVLALNVDPTFQDRLNILYPLYALRWVMIILNEFLPERWTRRLHAGAASDLEAVQSRQLRKAKDALMRLSTLSA